MCSWLCMGGRVYKSVWMSEQMGKWVCMDG